VGRVRRLGGAKSQSDKEGDTGGEVKTKKFGSGEGDVVIGTGRQVIVPYRLHGLKDRG
jgi:hypothetical protein